MMSKFWTSLKGVAILCRVCESIRSLVMCHCQENLSLSTGRTIMHPAKTEH